MKSERTIPGRQRRRRTVRLKDFDYAQPGGYFITVCTQDRRCLWGSVHAGDVWLNEIGRIAEKCWKDIPAHFPNVRMDTFCVMPNHLHGILLFGDKGRGTTCRAPMVEAKAIRETAETKSVSGIGNAEQFAQPVSGSLPTVVRSFKAAVTKHVRRPRTNSEQAYWGVS